MQNNKEKTDFIRKTVSDVDKLITKNKESFVGDGEIMSISYNQGGIVIFFFDNEVALRNEITWEEFYDFIDSVE